MALSDAFRSAITAVAPVLGGALLGPAGAIGAAALSRALLGRPDGTPQELDQFIGSPELALKAQQAQNDYLVQIETLATQRYQAGVADTNSARNREEILKDDTTKHLAYLVTAFYFLIVGIFIVFSFVFHDTISETEKTLITILMTTLTTAWLQVIGYYFGSSMMSRMKNMGSS